jgi:hypothetical protein
VNQRQPYDEPAERAVIGACLCSDLAAEDVSRILTADDFHVLRHKAIYAAIVGELTEHRRIDMLAVHRRITGIDVDLAYLHELQNSTPTISNAVNHAEVVAAHKVRRDLIHAAAQISALGMEGVTDAADAAQQARDILATIDMPAGRGAPDPDIDTFVGSVDTTYDWLIPDFLERRDRMLVTAGEGHGKSMLLAQIAVQAAAGIHPWTRREVTPRNVLLVDLENGARLVTRRLAGLRAKAGERLDPQRLRVHTRPDGIDLTTRGDRRWLIDRCEANATELLVIGPAYRMSSGVAERGDVGGEDHARKITKALDEIRTICGVTLLLETHAPHGDQFGSRNLRPFGSTVWLRWPEFGVGIRPDKEDPMRRRYSFEHWRGPRDVRPWPISLERGGNWPWTPVMGAA